MEVNPYTNEDKEQRRRVIIVATTIAIIILGIAVWAIIAIVGNGKKTITADQPTSEVVSQTDSNKSSQITTQPTESVAPSSEGVSTTVENTTSTTTRTQATAATTNQVPETGPEEILPLALVLGSATAFVSSKKLAAARRIA